MENTMTNKKAYHNVSVSLEIMVQTEVGAVPTPEQVEQEIARVGHWKHISAFRVTHTRIENE